MIEALQTCFNIKHDCPIHREATGFNQDSVKIYSLRYETCLGKLIYRNKQLDTSSCESKISVSRVKALIWNVSLFEVPQTPLHYLQEMVTIIAKWFEYFLKIPFVVSWPY